MIAETHRAASVRAGSAKSRATTPLSGDYENVSDQVHYACYFDTHNGEIVGKYGGSHPAVLPRIHVLAVEESVQRLLEEYSLGITQMTQITVQDIVNKVIGFPNIYIIGQQAEAFNYASQSLISMISGGSVGSSATILASRPNTGFNINGSPSRPTTGMRMLLSGIVPAVSNQHEDSPLRARSPETRSGVRSARTPPAMVLGASGSLINNRGYAVSPAFSRTLNVGSSMGVSCTFEPMPQTDGSSEDHFFRNSLPSSTSFPGSFPGMFWAPRVQSPEESQKRSMPPTVVSSTALIAASRATSSTPSMRAITSNGSASSAVMHRSHSAAAGIYNSDAPAGIRGRQPGSSSSSLLVNNEVDVAFFDQNVPQQLPFFTEIVGEDKVKTGVALAFMTEKLRSKDLELAALHEELEMMRTNMEKSHDNLIALRNKVKITSLL